MERPLHGETEHGVTGHRRGGALIPASEHAQTIPKAPFLCLPFEQVFCEILDMKYRCLVV